MDATGFNKVSCFPTQSSTTGLQLSDQIFLSLVLGYISRPSNRIKYQITLERMTSSLIGLVVDLARIKHLDAINYIKLSDDM